MNRGSTWYSTKEYDKAIQDYSEAIRLDSKDATAFPLRGVAWYAKQEYVKAIEDYGKAIRLDPKDANTCILGHFAARRAKDDAAAKRFLKEPAGGLDESVWPYAAIKYLRGEIDEAALLKFATDDQQRMDARCYLGLDQALKVRRDEALAHFRWVKEHGNSEFVEFHIALEELDRLENSR